MLLKRNDKNLETALFYLSDHGESLGEGGVYLHGLPRAIAPDSQLHVPAILWFGSSFVGIDPPSLLRKRHQQFTHDHLFHTILGFFEVKTSFYKPDLDILDGSRKSDKGGGQQARGSPVRIAKQATVAYISAIRTGVKASRSSLSGGVILQGGPP